MEERRQNVRVRPDADLPAGLALVREGGEVELDVLDALTRLSERSMVAVRRPAEGGTRYEILETLRAYGRSQLTDATAQSISARHAAHHNELAARLATALGGPDEHDAVLNADRSFADLRSAFRHRVDTGEIDAALGLVASMREYAMRSMRYEVFGWAEQALALAQAIERGYFDLDAPDQSLFLRKPLAPEFGGLPHGGGAKMRDLEDPMYLSSIAFLELMRACRDAQE